MAMDVEDDPEINLAIPLKPVYEEFNCPICFNIIQDCHITPCGHAFCAECIQECINRKHQCPCCNAKTTAEELSRNKHADRVIAILVAEKDKASKAYFEQLIAGGAAGVNNKPNGNANNGAGGAPAPLSPIESVFQKHMKKSLLAYEDYYQKLKQKFESGVESLKKELAAKMVKAADDKQHDMIPKMKAEFEQKVSEMKTVFAKSEEMLLLSYEGMLKEAEVTPQFLPVQVFVTVQCKEGFRFPLVVKPTENAKDVKALLQQFCEKNGDPIVRISKKAFFSIRKPYAAKLDDAAAAAAASAPKKKKHVDKEEVVIEDEDMPIRQYNPDPGSLLVLNGTVKFKSDAPKVCFRASYEKDKGMTCDYYKCAECKINWICKSCAEACHKGHTLSDYLLAHKPTWGCCYCVKTGKCTIPVK